MDIIRHRRQGYLNTFKKDDRFANIVLADLARFCRAGETPYHTDQRMTDILIGRREVWLRIAQHLNMDESELYDLLAGRK
jgi:hypothetical protein